MTQIGVMNLLLLAIAPGIAICLYIYFKDKYNKEPFKNLALSFLLGVLAAIPAVIIEHFATTWSDRFLEQHLNTVAYIFFQAFIIVALTEEYVKYFMLTRYSFKRSAFDEPLDGIVYSVMVSMGFATIENIGYVFQHGWQTGVLRMFLSVPAHACFGILMGYYIGLAKFASSTFLINQLKIKGLLIAVLFHGFFDVFLFLAESKLVTIYISAGLLILGAILSYLIAIKLALKMIKEHRTLSKHQNTFSSNETIEN